MKTQPINLLKEQKTAS